MDAAEGEDGAEVPRKRVKASHAAAQQGEQQHPEYQNIARLAQARSPRQLHTPHWLYRSTVHHFFSTH